MKTNFDERFEKDMEDDLGNTDDEEVEEVEDEDQIPSFDEE